MTKNNNNIINPLSDFQIELAARSNQLITKGVMPISANSKEFICREDDSVQEVLKQILETGNIIL